MHILITLVSGSVLQVTTNSYPGTCKESEKTMKKVDSCPKNKMDWIKAANITDCNSVRQNCSNEKFQYHCLWHGSGTYLVEVCAPIQLLAGGFCGEYDDIRYTIQSRFKASCKDFDVPCPSVYISNTSYKYQECYEIVRRLGTFPHADDSRMDTTEKRNEIEDTTSNGCQQKNKTLVKIGVGAALFHITCIIGSIFIFTMRKKKGILDRQSGINHPISSTEILIDADECSNETLNFGGKTQGSYHFKRKSDCCLNKPQFDSLSSSFQSVGCLNSQMSISTVFRVGQNYVMTVAHHVHDIMKDNFGCDRSNLIENDNVFVEFRSKETEFENRFYISDIKYFDIENDTCVLELKFELFKPFPPHFTHFTRTTVQSLVHFIGFGHDKHNIKTIEQYVKVLSKESEKVTKALNWIETNRNLLLRILDHHNISRDKIRTCYSILGKEGIFPLNCYMEHGSSGSPGFAMTENGAAVSLMIQGGLPTICWDIGSDACYIPIDHRIEYGVSMESIYNNMLKKDYKLAQEIFCTGNDQICQIEQPMNIS